MTLNRKYAYFILIVIIVLSVLLGALPHSVTPHALWPHWSWQYKPLHSAMEAVGAIIAILITAIIFLRKPGEAAWKVYFPAIGFISMGMFDGFHSASTPGHGFVLSHNMAVLAGGFFFALSWIPEPSKKCEGWKVKWSLWVVAAGSFLLGGSVLLFREKFPLMVQNGEFTDTAIAMNLIGGLFFIIAFIRFLIYFQHTGSSEDYLFACSTLLFGLAGILFKYSAPWDDIWWVWHFLRLAAYFLVFSIVIRLHYLTTTGLRNSLAGEQRSQDKLKKTLSELERINKELEQFIHIATHDLQEPLRRIAGFVQLLSRRYKGKLDKDADEFISFAVDGVYRMQRMINALLILSGVATAKKPFRQIDSETALNIALANLKKDIEESGAMITHDRLPTVIADSMQLVMLFQNLLDNAIKFRSEAPPCIHVSAEERENEWVFLVSDNGIGIDPAYFDRIFIIFQRLHAGEKYGGTGTGLTICKKIIGHHGGRIWVESELGKGSKFYFIIPKEGGQLN